ncbi:probable RNA 3'-terminal phosphate cyclase-like protein [Salvia miltiorrhiza]|uniref:probable RNA 3'-terminal phosphate cyclase-like protein n=1 Tax=Salvia miltiorrhiza TaxID=226208 RepID=UPI0025ACFF19|nr:probable RNA 3'-terminal phosphate cyclase-like protein [Salvia miltiorrhiza]XP_057809988.1 probable RNA 3'-terminal phosphate cyclase-like protein [Salvia miltiorrhiza]
MRLKRLKKEDKFSDMRLKVCRRGKEENRRQIKYKVSQNQPKEIKKFKGSQNLRMRLLLSTLTHTPIEITDIRTDGDGVQVGLRPYEVSLLRLLMLLSNNCYYEINDTGTKVEYKPGTLMGGRHLVYNCGQDRAIGYFLEPLLILALYGRNQLSIDLIGITNDSRDPSVDTFRSTTIPLLKRFGIPSESLDLKIKSRGVPPKGGGKVELSISPIMQNTLKALTWIDTGLVKSIRGLTFSARVSAQFEHKILQAARGILKPFLQNIPIDTDHKKGLEAGLSPGYGISLVAETTSGCCISADTTVSYPYSEQDSEEKDLSTAEDAGRKVASDLLHGIEEYGVVDSTHQGLLFLLCALSAEDVSKVRVGKLSPNGIGALGEIQHFLNVTFAITPDPSTESVLLTCVGCGQKNLSRKAS